MTAHKPVFVSVWYAHTAWLSDPALRQRCMSLLDAAEEATRARFVVAHARDGYLLAHALCRVALSHHRAGVAPAAWRFARGARGKPVVLAPGDGTPLHFNISHCRTTVAVAVSAQHPVGVDVEDAGRAVNVARLGPRVLTRREYEACVGHAYPRTHFLRHWTLKEAYLKARGEGISERLTAIDMGVDGAAPNAPVTVTDTRAAASGGPWHLRVLTLGAAAGDVAGPACVLAAVVQAAAEAAPFVWSDARALLMV